MQMCNKIWSIQNLKKKKTVFYFSLFSAIRLINKSNNDAYLRTTYPYRNYNIRCQPTTKWWRLSVQQKKKKKGITIWGISSSPTKSQHAQSTNCFTFWGSFMLYRSKSRTQQLKNIKIRGRNSLDGACIMVSQHSYSIYQPGNNKNSRLFKNKMTIQSV